MSRFTEFDVTGLEYYSIPNFNFSTGEKLDVKVAYRSFNPSSSQKVLIPTCYGGRINTTYNYVSGALSSYHVIVVAMLGNGESSSPSNTPNFPKSIHYQDCVNSQYALLTEHLKISVLDAVIGFSMGGQQAYYWAVMHSTNPSFQLKSVVAICSSAKTSGHNYAFLEGPIAALSTSFDYDKGRYRQNDVKPTEGLRAFARAYAAWVTSPEWFRRELWRKMGAASLKDWLYPPIGNSWFESWDAEDMLIVARMWQLGDVGTLVDGGDYRKALEGIKCRVLVMPSRTDQYFTTEASEIEVKSLQRGRLEVIETIWGHIAGGAANPDDLKFMDEKIREFLGAKEAGNKL